MDRISIYALYHNLKKPYRESQGDNRTHAEVAGMDPARVESMLYGLFSRREFVSQLNPEGIFLKQWLRLFPTPLKKKKELLPKHAAA